MYVDRIILIHVRLYQITAVESWSGKCKSISLLLNSNNSNNSNNTPLFKCIT